MSFNEQSQKQNEGKLEAKKQVYMNREDDFQDKSDSKRTSQRGNYHVRNIFSSDNTIFTTASAKH